MEYFVYIAADKLDKSHTYRAVTSFKVVLDGDFVNKRQGQMASVQDGMVKW